MTKPADYVELHASSAFSFLEAASQPEDLVRAAVEAGMPALALLDRNGVYGAARFHSSARQRGDCCRRTWTALAASSMAATSTWPGTSAAVSALLRTGGLPKSLPTHYSLQDAREDKVRRRCDAR